MTLRLTARHITLLRALVHLASLGFLLWLLVAVPGGLLGGSGAGADPLSGQGALNLLLLTLLVSPLAKRWRQGQLISCAARSGSGAPRGPVCISWSGWGWICSSTGG